MVYYRDFITTSVSSGAGTYNLHTSHEFNPLIFSGVYVAIYYVKKMFCQTLFVFPYTNTAGAEMMLQIQHEKMSCQHIFLLNRDRGHT
jgi:hypothetical protein